VPKNVGAVLGGIIVFGFIFAPLEVGSSFAGGQGYKLALLGQIVDTQPVVRLVQLAHYGVVFLGILECCEVAAYFNAPLLGGPPVHL